MTVYLARQTIQLHNTFLQNMLRNNRKFERWRFTACLDTTRTMFPTCGTTSAVRAVQCNSLCSQHRIWTNAAVAQRNRPPSVFLRPLELLANKRTPAKDAIFTHNECIQEQRRRQRWSYFINASVKSHEALRRPSRVTEGDGNTYWHLFAYSYQSKLSNLCW